MKIRTIAILVALSSAIGLMLYFGTHKDPPKTPEEAVQASLDEMVSAAKEGDLSGILEGVSESFNGQGMDRDGLKGMLFLQLRRGSWQSVMLRNPEVELRGPKSAQLRATVLMAQGSSFLPENADSITIELSLALEGDGRWRVVGGRWER